MLGVALGVALVVWLTSLGVLTQPAANKEGPQAKEQLSQLLVSIAYAYARGEG